MSVLTRLVKPSESVVPVAKTDIKLNIVAGHLLSLLGWRLGRGTAPLHWYLRIRDGLINWLCSVVHGVPPARSFRCGKPQMYCRERTPPLPPALRTRTLPYPLSPCTADVAPPPTLGVRPAQ